MVKLDEDGVLAGSRSKPVSLLSKPPSWWMLRILALLGVLYIVERTTTYFVWKHQDRPFFSSPLAPGGGNIFRESDRHAIVDDLTHLPPSSNSSEHQVAPSKALIVAATKKEDPSWVEENFTDWEIYIYKVDDHSANNTVLEQGGHEAAVYLTWIIQHYVALPEYMVFLHARRYQWHNDDPLYDGVPPVKNLRLEHVKRVGYQSMRCAWNPGCGKGSNPWTPQKGHSKGHDRVWKLLNAVLPEEEIPTRLRAPCCAQFAVHRDTVLARPVWQYERMRKWLWDSDMRDGISGRLFEYTWHLVFGQPGQSCPRAEDCYCQAFGLCNLPCDEKSHCHGRWKLPPWGHMVPVKFGWPEIGGIKGYPKLNWYKRFEPWKSGGTPDEDPKGKLKKGKFRYDKKPALRKAQQP